MQRNTASFSITGIENFKQQMLSWANQFSICCFLDSNQYNDKFHSYEWLLAAGAVKIFSPQKNILQLLYDFYESHNDWLFGHMSYELKNEVEQLTSLHSDHIGFQDIFLFRPEIVLQPTGNLITISCLNKEPAEVFKAIQSQEISNLNYSSHISIRSGISKEKYVEIIKLLRQHILHGDCYEINYCMEFFAENVATNHLSVYRNLATISPNPFSC